MNAPIVVVWNVGAAPDLLEELQQESSMSVEIVTIELDVSSQRENALPAPEAPQESPEGTAEAGWARRALNALRPAFSDLRLKAAVAAAIVVQGWSAVQPPPDPLPTPPSPPGTSQQHPHFSAPAEPVVNASHPRTPASPEESPEQKRLSSQLKDLGNSSGHHGFPDPQHPDPTDLTDAFLTLREDKKRGRAEVEEATGGFDRDVDLVTADARRTYNDALAGYGRASNLRLAAADAEARLNEAKTLDSRSNGLKDTDPLKAEILREGARAVRSSVDGDPKKILKEAELVEQDADQRLAIAEDMRATVLAYTDSRTGDFAHEDLRERLRAYAADLDARIGSSVREQALAMQTAEEVDAGASFEDEIGSRRSWELGDGEAGR